MGRKNVKATATDLPAGHNAGHGRLDKGSVSSDAGTTDIQSLGRGRRRNALPKRTGEATQPLVNAQGMDGLDGGGAVVGAGSAGVRSVAASDTDWQERVRRLLGKEGTARFESGVLLIADQAARLDRIAVTAQERYLDGIDKTVVKQSGDVVTFKEYDTDEARVAIAAMDAIGKRVPIFVPDKVALTNPDGDEAYRSLDDEALKREAGRILGIVDPN